MSFLPLSLLFRSCKSQRLRVWQSEWLSEWEYREKHPCHSSGGNFGMHYPLSPSPSLSSFLVTPVACVSRWDTHSHFYFCKSSGTGVCICRVCVASLWLGFFGKKRKDIRPFIWLYSFTVDFFSSFLSKYFWLDTQFVSMYARVYLDTFDAFS